MQLIKPAYIISVSCINCKIEVWCNDIIIFEHKSKSTAKGNRISISIPINHILIQNQEFDIRAMIFPAHGKDTLELTSATQIGLYLLDYIAPKKTEVKLLTLNTPNINSKEEQLLPIRSLSGLPQYELYGIFKAKALPFKIKGWVDSIDLSKINTQKLFKDTYNFYQKLFQSIATKNTETYFQLTNERDQLLADVYYKSRNKTKVDDLEFLDVLNETGLELLPFDFKDVEIQVMGRGKLIRLIRKNGFPALVLYNPTNKKTVKLDIKLHKKNMNSPLSII